MEKNIEERVQLLERNLKTQRRVNLILVSLIGIGISAISFAAVKQTTFDLIHAKGLIIDDQNGRPRIAIGASLEKIPGRARQDAIDGIVYMDEKGKDRLTFGKEPDPMTPKGIVPRRTPAAGILIHDKDGIERGGYAVMDDDSAVLTLDWPKTGEGVALSANSQFSGMGLFYKSESGFYRDSIGMFTSAKDDKVSLKVTDSVGNQRALLSSKGTEQPRLQQFDQSGKEISGKL